MGKEDKKLSGKARKMATGAAVAILLLMAMICAVYMLRFVSKQGGISLSIDLSECASHGYVQDGNFFINEIGDANIQLPEIEQYVAWLSVKFSDPIEQPLNITVYYAEADHGYSEGFTVSAELDINSNYAQLYIGEEITTCRIDIGTSIGEKFTLESISINDEQVVNKAVRLELFMVVVLFFLAVCFVVTALVLFVYRLGTEKVFTMLALSLGFVYLITITPLSVPDEPHHYQSAYWLSNVLLFHWDEYGDSTDFDYSAFVGHHNVSSGYLYVMENVGGSPAKGEVVQIPEPRAMSYFVEYLPQALGIALSRITNQNFIRTFLIGRLFNLIFYSGCLYFAIKRAPIFKIMFGLIGIMPMALHQAASYSYDGFINGMALLLIASMLKAIYEDGPLSKKDFYCILILGALLTPAKPVYFPILFLAVLIPERRFGGRKEKIIGIALVWIAGAVFAAGFQLQSLFTLATGSSHGLNQEGCYNYTMSFVFEHPWKTTQIFVGTFYKLALDWLKCAIGQAMSGLTLILPTWIIYGYMGVIALSVLNHERSDYVLRAGDRTVFLLVSMIVVLLVMLSMFLAWTSDFRTVITGIQGRYFIPVMPLLALLLNNQVLILRKNVDRTLIVVAVLLQCAVLTNVLNYTLLN